ncbi:MAG: hypothetical protein Kow00107_03660 [Planctomycetota bacterium]
MLKNRPDDRFEIRLSGTGGQGIITACMILGEAFSLHGGQNVCMTQSYGPEARGGACRAELVVSRNEIDAPKVGKADLLLAMSQEAYNKYRDSVKEWGIIIVDSSLVEFERAENVFPFPFTSVAREKVGFAVTANIVAVGFVAGLAGFHDREALKTVVGRKVPPGTEATNFKALDLGFDASCEPLSNFGIPVTNYVRTDFIKVSPDTTIRTAVKYAVENNLEAVIVTNNGQVKGIFTQYDAIRAIAKGANPAKALVKDYMTKQVYCCKTTSTIGEVLLHMEGRNFKNVPVIDSNDNIVGVVSYYGVQDAYRDDGIIDEAFEFIDTTRNLLTGGRWSALKTISVNPQKVGIYATAIDVAVKMSRAKTDCVIVVDEDERPIGIITEVDIAKRVIAKGALLTTPVEKIMTRRVVFLENTETITTAFEKMLKAKVHHLPLVNKNGKLTGSVRYRDIAHAVNSRLYLGETMVSDQIPSSDD